MEQSEDTPLESNVLPAKNDENWEEWTIIDEDDNAKKLLRGRAKISSPESEDSENTSDAEEAHELTVTKLTKQKSEEPVPNPEKEESDGVSVISESENEERTVNDTGRIVLYRSVSQGTEELELQNSNKEVTWCVCLLIACSVLIAIGASLASYARSSIPKDMDYFSLKMENDRLVERMKEFTDVKGILEEIKSNLVEERSPVDIETPPKGKVESRDSNNQAKSSWDRGINEPEGVFSERLQILLHTICLMLDDMGQPQESTVSQRPLCDTRTFFSDLANLRNSLHDAIGEMDETTGLTNRQFLRDIDFRIASMSDSLVVDLTRALGKLSLRNEQKLDKIIGKMNEKLCVLRNTMPSDSKVRKSLEMNVHFIESCEKHDGSRRGKRSSETRNDSPPPSQTTFQKKNFKCPRDNIHPNSNENNSTKPYNRSSEYHRNVWKEKNRNDEKSNHFKHRSQESKDETCSVPSTPPAKKSSTWKWSKQQKSLHPPLLSKDEVKIRDDSLEKENSARNDKPNFRFHENNDGILSEKKNWKKKTGRDEAKNRKRSLSMDEYEIDNEKRRMKEKNLKVASHLPSNVKDDLEIPMETTIPRRMKKKYEETEKRRSNGRKEKNDIGSNGQWQFARSQIRDELRKAESLDNWYLDRMRSRRSSRGNIEDSEEHR
ncbi:uncharacterized protein [Venturia canescens]|uniref:uncharacterized protein n=1 Tax=Venturia canescens TaxID=32260 RepID=UPI001C9C5A97|nr:uncharacterized protein LOC122412940 [Venturia canescens]